MRRPRARSALPLPMMLALVLPAFAASDDGPRHATPILLGSETFRGDACMPELAALAMVERMAKVLGKDADVLAEAEEDLRSKAADCLDGDDDVTEVSHDATRHDDEAVQLGL